jgi:hypothetical protein
MRFYDPASGSVLLDGQDIKFLQPRWLRAQVHPKLLRVWRVRMVSALEPGVHEGVRCLTLLASLCLADRSRESGAGSVQR